MERVGSGCHWGGEQERKGGGCNPIGERRGGRLGLGRKKMTKDLLFSEECLLKLQTPMPQNIKEKRKISLTSFQKIWGITLYPP
jgi:hypothetical protein